MKPLAVQLRRAAAALPLCLGVAALAQATAPAPCTAAAAQQLDFWLGTWRGTWRDGSTGQAQEAINTVSKVHGGCAVLEEFRQQGAAGLTGTSLSAFDSRAGRWQQTWVDNQGSWLVFDGALEEGEMRFSRPFVTRDQRTVHQRMRFTQVRADSFVWLWQRSLDGGNTWETTWTIQYQRLAPAR
jgi:hypothetical protein